MQPLSLRAVMVLAESFEVRPLETLHTTQGLRYPAEGG
jgi:hypothetical protein